MDVPTFIGRNATGVAKFFSARAERPDAGHWMLVGFHLNQIKKAATTAASSTSQLITVLMCDGRMASLVT